MNTKSQEIVRSLLAAYKKHQVIVIETNDNKRLTGSVAGLNDEDVFISQPAKQPVQFKLTDIKIITILHD